MAIQSFKDQEAASFHADGKTKADWQGVKKIVARKLDMLEAAVKLEDLASPPANMLEALKGDRQGQHSIRVNLQWRVCFIWTDAGPKDVEVTDYH